MTQVTSTPLEHVNILREFQEREVDYLVSLIGQGEDPRLANNQSKFIRMMRSTDGTGKGPKGESWCAVTRSHAGIRAAVDMSLEMPYAPHRGARRLTKNIAAVGGWIVKPKSDPYRNFVIPKGAALCKKTGPVWKGHFMSVVFHNRSTDVVTIIEGNKNNRIAPSGRRYAVIDVRDLKPSEWRRDLYGISALWVPSQPGAE